MTEAVPKVRDIMSTLVLTVAPEATVSEVARLMLEKHLSGLPVVKEGEMIGLVTLRDIVTKHAHPHVPFYLGFLGGVLPVNTRREEKEVRRVLAVTARDLMTDDPPTVEPDAEASTAADIMVELDANPLPVIENGRLVGIVSEEDILRLVVIEEGNGTAAG